MDKDVAKAIAGPFFSTSLFPYLAFLYFLNVKNNDCPKGVTIGFATCLLFVFLSIVAGIEAKILYGVSLADSDWLHGSAESLLTVTNLVTVIAFRQSINAKEKGLPMPESATSWAPMVWLVVGLTTVAIATVFVPVLSGEPTVHTPYLAGFMDLPFNLESFGAHPEPENALTIATWIIHLSSLVEYLVVMGYAWRWADAVNNPTWKGLTWGLLPLHSSGITACTSHIFYNQIPILVPFQAFLTFIGNTTSAIAAYRIARSNGWKPDINKNVIAIADKLTRCPPPVVVGDFVEQKKRKIESEPCIGFKNLGDALAEDTDYTFLIKLFIGCAIASYILKYGETFVDFPYKANVYHSFTIIAIPSTLNAFMWYKRSQDPTFEGWF